jgi:peptide/nickel transport system substrate-binding protein
MPADIQKDFNYDTARARQLLADAGYPNGFTTEVVTTVASDLLTSVKTDWAKVGITCNFRIVQAQVYSGTLLRRNYTDMCAVISGAAGYQNNAATFSSTSYTPAYSPEFDELQNQFVTEVATDLDKSYALTVDMQNMAMRNHWAIHLVPSPGSNIVWYPWLKNVWCSTADNNAWIPVLARCWIDQDLRFKVTGVKQTPSNFKGAR